MHLSLSREKYLSLVFFLYCLPTFPFSALSCLIHSAVTLCNYTWIYSAAYYDSLRFLRSLSILKPFVPHPGRSDFLSCPGGNIRWPGSPQQNPGHQGGLLSQYPSFSSLSSTSYFQVRGKVEALRLHSPDLTTRQTGGTVLFVPTRTLLRLFFASSRCLAFISLALAFTAINTDSAVIFFYCCDFF